MEGGSSEEEACSPTGEHIEPGELLQHHVDGKSLPLYTQAVDLSHTHTLASCSSTDFLDV